MSTRVLFRRAKYDDDTSEIVAVFPQMPGTYDAHTMTCYAHMGQHGTCSLDWYNGTKPATPDEYAKLQRELERIGYGDLVVAHRITPHDHEARHSQLAR